MIKAEAPTTDLLRSVTGATFRASVLEGRGPIAVEFMSYGCGHCRALEPVLQQVAATLRSREQIFRANTAVDAELAANYEIEGTPTLVMFLDGREVGRVVGPHPTVATLTAALTEPFAS